MRQRKLKNLEDRLRRLEKWIVKKPEDMKGFWNEHFDGSNLGEKEIYLEIGCGKGKFIVEKAMYDNESNFIALEGEENVIVRAIEKAEEMELRNIAFINLYLEDICQYFQSNEINGLYLNFSDPWPKARHAKRRLTHRRFLEKYKNIIKEDGFIEIKTDNDDLYDFTLEEIRALGYEIEEISRDLHNADYVDKNVMTEYEEKFSSRGKNINYVKVRFGGEADDFSAAK